MTSDIVFAPAPSATLEASGKFPFDIRVLMRSDDRREAFAVRYKAYRHAGHIPETADGLYSDPADAWPTTALIAAYDKGKCVGVIRLAVSQPWQPASTLPCARYYPALNAIKAAAPRAVIEIGRLAIDPAITNTSYRTTLFAALIRACFIAAQAVRASHIVLTARAVSTGFHTSMLGFEQYGEPAFYPPGDLPIAMLVGTLGQAELKQRAQNMFFRIRADEIASMRGALEPLTAPPVLRSPAGERSAGDIG